MAKSWVTAQGLPSSRFGDASTALPITKGSLDLGPWPQIVYAEFDGQRPKGSSSKYWAWVDV
jgi:Uncharacterised protein family UPF0047